jgi:chorismate dehydratase
MFESSKGGELFYNKYACRGGNSGLLYLSFKETSTVKKLRISIVQYLNTAPLVWGFTNGPLRGKYDLSFTVPSQCAEQLRTGQADIAIIPAIEYARIPDLEILPELSIASKKMVRSLLLISKAPIGQFKSVALDSSSRSTQALMRILCAEHWKIAPQFIEMPPDLDTMLKKADAALLIGDPALRLSLKMETYSTRIADHGSQVALLKPPVEGWMWNSERASVAPPSQRLFVFDMVEQWRAMTSLPAVLAVWAARKGLATPEVVADFHASRDFGMSRIAEISSAAARELDLPADKLESYLRDNIDFSLDHENRRGLESYFAYAAKLGLIPQAKPIDWASAEVVGAAFRGGPLRI